MRQPCSIALLVFALAAPMPTPASAQDSGDRAEVMRVVEGLFTAMKIRDTAAVRNAFDPAATLITPFTQKGTPGVEVSTVGDFVNAVAQATGPEWDERMRKIDFKIDGTLAAVWTTYDFFLGEKHSHCGVDAFHLAKTTAGWKIFHLADTRRRTGCNTKL